MTTSRGDRGIVGVAALSLALALVPGGGAAQAAESDMTVVDVVVTPTVDDLADGFATLTVDVTLTSTTPLEDGIQCGVLGEGPGAYAVPVDVDGRLVRPWEIGGPYLSFDDLVRVSGTPTDGVWRATKELSQVFSGSWLVTKVCDPSVPGNTTTVDVSDFAATFDLGPPTGPSWVISPDSDPVRIVTGGETWVPGARIADRVTGHPVSGFWTEFSIFSLPTSHPSARVGPPNVLPRADASGRIRLPARPVASQDGDASRDWLLAYAGRGGRGYSWEADTVVWPNVKWQANQRFATSGRAVAVSGNAWPAPAVYSAVNPTIHLQQLVGRTWRTVASGRVRDNGRYSIAWTAPGAGPQVLRVYKPGGATAGPLYRTSVGSTLAAVTVTTR